MRIGYSNSSGSSNYCRVLFDLAIEFLRLSKPPYILGGIAASVAVYLATCADLARRIEDFAPIESHDAYVARLKAGHGTKTGFWSKVEGA
jgi:hypothetical protein